MFQQSSCWLAEAPSWFSGGGEFVARGYGATAARLTPDQKVGSSNLSALILRVATAASVVAHLRAACQAHLMGWLAAVPLALGLAQHPQRPSESPGCSEHPGGSPSEKPRSTLVEAPARSQVARSTLVEAPARSQGAQSTLVKAWAVQVSSCRCCGRRFRCLRRRLPGTVVVVVVVVVVRVVVVCVVGVVVRVCVGVDAVWRALRDA